MTRKASILVGVLWCLALLSIVVIGVLHTARLDLLVVKHYGDRVQARYLALAGVEKAKALLYQDARERSRSAQHHTGALFNAPEHFREVSLGRGQFRVLRRAPADEGGELIYGVSDEESRLNLNTVEAEELGRLPGLTSELLPAILDWRDADNAVSPGGAEAEYYLSLRPPRLPRNGPFQTTRELLMVQGVSREGFFGDDINQNGRIDVADRGRGPANRVSAGPPNPGWAPFLTVDSSVKNLNAAGEERVNVQTADQRTLEGVRGLTSDIARAIVAYRGQNRLESIADLLDVRQARTQNNPRETPNPTENPDGQNVEFTGPTLISEELLRQIADDVTTESDANLPGVVSVNTASLPVLACLPGLDRELAQAIIAFRQSNGYFANVAWLLRVPGIRRDIFKQLAPRVTVRSETFRIVSEGQIRSSGVRQRLEVIVHISLSGVETLSWREDL